jgi:ABC-type transporter Mla MlaB component
MNMLIRRPHIPEHSGITLVVRAADGPDPKRATRKLFSTCEAMLACGAAGLTIDLSHVHAADTSLVAGLVAIHRAARARGAHLEVKASPEIELWVRHCRLDAMLHHDAPWACETRSNAAA